MRRRGGGSSTLAVGLMSGTSADGIDAALVSIRERDGSVAVRTRAALTVPYPEAVRARLLRVPDVDAREAARLHVLLGERLAEAATLAIRRGRARPRDVAFVASHGHTLVHLPRRGGRGASLQIGDPATIAERTGVPVIADFRPRDVAAGGEGAPLVPFADRLLLARDGEVVAAQNVGGIANVTCLGPRRGDLVAFDTGPGMMAIDLAVAHATGGRMRYDAGGRIARSGRADPGLLRDLMANPYFLRPPPKSTGREDFGAPFVAPLLKRARTPRERRDLVLTLTAFTAASIADAYARYLPRVDECVVSGGGVHDLALMGLLAAALSPRRTRVVSSAKRGVHPDFKEAVAFALLGWAHARGEENTCPAATGASRAVVAGAVWPGRDARGRSRSVLV
jgi:anhydro-N-acetylmuramic acid kinase